MTTSRLDQLPLFDNPTGGSWSIHFDEAPPSHTLARILIEHVDGRRIEISSFVSGLPPELFDGWKMRAMREAWHKCRALDIQEQKPQRSRMD